MEEVIRKIRKMLALANDNAKHSDESDTAMLLAQKMMAKHNISMTDINFDEVENKKNVTEGYGTEYIKLQWWMKSLGKIISDNFKCYYFYRTSGSKSRIVFLGLENDVELCKIVYEFAVNAIKYHSAEYMKRRGVSGDRGITTAIKNDYIAGYINGLGDKFKEQVKTENFLMIIEKDALVVQAYKKKHLVKGRGSTATTRGDSMARQHGYADGKKFSHNTGAIE